MIGLQKVGCGGKISPLQKETGKIRILQVAQEPVTIWAFLTGLIKELEKRGYDVEAACNMSSPEMVKELQESGIKLNIVDIRRSVNPCSMLKAFLEFRKLFKAKKFDIVAAHTPIAAFAARFAAYSCRIPVIIYTAHGLPFMEGMNPLKYMLFYSMEKLAGRVTTGIVCINEEDYEIAVKKRLVRTGYVKKINGIGIDTEKYRPLDADEKDKAREEFLKIFLDNKIPPHSLLLNLKIVGFIGRLIKAKGIDEYLEMAKNIAGKRDDVLFLIAGYGPLEGYVKRYIHAGGLDGRMKFLGFAEDAKKIFDILDVFVLPTYYPEGMPRTVLEAMSMEVPVVTTCVRGCRELVEDGRTGCIVLPGNVAELERAVQKLLDDKGLRRAMGQAGRKKVVEGYGLSKAIEEQIGFYEELLKDVRE